MKMGAFSRFRVPPSGLVVALLLSSACGQEKTPNADRYVTTGSTDGLAFVASLEHEPPILEHVPLRDIPASLAKEPLVRDGLLKIARADGFDEASEVRWVRRVTDEGHEATVKLAFNIADGKKGRDADWWGTISRRNGDIIVDRVMGSGHGPR